MNIIQNNLANILTVSRLLLLPVIIALFFAEDAWGGFAVWLCLFVYIIGAVTDFIDGYIARKFNQISGFGTFLDPISDKIYISTLLILLVAFERIEGVWITLVILIFAREFLISGLREFLGPKNIKMPVSLLAKWKTTVQMLSLGFLIIGNNYAPYTTELGLGLLSLATLLTLITGLSYMNIGIAHLREDKDDHQPSV
ncbi:MAG: CDP-diacylglycerol--glycerol-3-phosphate 3-phosphatidyltransferase [Alphaproteobacteria bacterium]